MTIEPLLIVHGGAGDITDARVNGKLNGMKKAVRAGLVYLQPTAGSAGSALKAVEEAVRVMELDENFNAGYGACVNTDGKAEVEASIMSGDNLKAGCVTLLHDIMHPISVARCVMEQSNHTFLGGTNAQAFALQNNFEQLQDGALVTQAALDALNEFLKRRAANKSTLYARTELDVDRRGTTGEPSGETVGAVAIDALGNIAAATSTGGITGKVPGRIGDTPLLGCGTYADNTVGGVSTTGHGETLMRYNLAQRILARIQYTKASAQQATELECKTMTERLGGTGGAITIDANGEPGFFWTSKRMGWAYARNSTLYYGIDSGIQNEERL